MSLQHGTCIVPAHCSISSLLQQQESSALSVLVLLVLQVEQRLQAKELEVQELMGMCDQLLQQREAQQ